MGPIDAFEHGWGDISMFSDRSFGEWLRRQRREMDFTRDEMATRVGCSAITLRKLEAEERRPSRQMAERLAQALQIPGENWPAFVRFARGDPFAFPADTQPAHAPSSKTWRFTWPNPLTSFVGRKQDLARLTSILATTRLITLTGVGGVGKTRLALEFIELVQKGFPDGVWWVDLAPLAQSELVPRSVANVLGVKEEVGQPVVDTLIEAWREKTAWIVLDNCEHLIQACAQLTEALLRGCRNLKILATSREVLGLTGEVIFAVPPLSTPTDPDQVTDDILERYDAVRLLADRAAAALPGFEIASGNRQVAARLCVQLDGIPLALELAAARVRMLSLDQILERLTDRFQLLGGGNRASLSRHQTLAALIAWSHDLLTPAEQALLRRLAVFVGGWSLTAAEFVGACDEGAPAEVLGLLGRLVDKSMVQMDAPVVGQAARYRILETVRSFALDRLAASDEQEAIHRRHAEYFVALAKRVRHELEPAASDDPWPERISAYQQQIRLEIDNYRAVIARSQSGLIDLKYALDLIPPIVNSFYTSGLIGEVRGWLERLWAGPSIDRYPEYHKEYLQMAGSFAAYQSDYAVAHKYFVRHLEFCQAAQDISGTAQVLERLGWLVREQGDTSAARKYLEESSALFRKLGQDPDPSILNTLGQVLIMEENAAEAEIILMESLAAARAVDAHPQTVGYTLNHLGHVAQLRGDYEQARRLHTESRQTQLRSGPNDPGVAWADHGLGETALANNDAQLAEAHLSAALRLFRSLGDRAGVSWCLAGLAGVAAIKGEPEQAARLWGAAEGLRRRLKARTAPACRATRERLQQMTRERLGEAAYAQAWTDGEGLSLASVFAITLGNS